MKLEDLSWIAMACFVEEIDPASLALEPRHVLKVESIIADLKREAETDAYYECLMALSAPDQGVIR